VFGTIMWATDGSEAADRALPFARELAEGDGKSLVVAHCNEYFFGRGGGYPVFADEEELQAKIRGQVAELQAEGIRATLKIVATGSTSPAHVLADVAREFHPDVIVVGTRGHAPIAGLLLGSVTQRLLHIAPCPVLAVPAGKHAAFEESEQREEVTVGGV